MQIHIDLWVQSPDLRANTNPIDSCITPMVHWQDSCFWKHGKWILKYLNSVLNKQKGIPLKAEFRFFATADKLSCDVIAVWYFGGSPFTRYLSLLWFSLFITTASSEAINLSACAFISSGICPATSFKVLQVWEFLLSILFFLTSSLFRLCASLRFFHSSLPSASVTAGSVPAIFNKYLQILGICGEL